MKRYICAVLTLVFILLLSSCFGNRADKYIYSFDFDLNGKKSDTSTETAEGETAYTVSDKNGNTYEQKYKGEDLVFERIKDKNGRVLYTSDVYFLDYSENIRYSYATQKSYFYNGDRLIKEAVVYLSDVIIVHSDAFDTYEGPVFPSHDINEDEIPVKNMITMPYIDESFFWKYWYNFNGKNSYFAQYETDYEYKGGVRYISSVAYSTEYAAGKGKFKYNGDGTCTLEFSSDGVFTPGAADVLTSDNFVFIPPASSDKLQRGIIPANTNKEKTSKTFEASFYCKTENGVCTVAEKPYQRTDYDGGGVSQIRQFNGEGNVTESEHYTNGGFVSVSTYEYDNGLLSKRSIFRDPERTDKSFERLLTYDTAYPDIVIKKALLYYTDGQISKTKNIDYKIVGEGKSAYGSVAFETEYDKNGTLIKKTEYVYDDDPGSWVETRMTEYENGSITRLLVNDYRSEDSNFPLVKEYNGDGKLIHKDWYEADGTHHDYSTYEIGCRYTVFDGSGNLMSEEYVEAIPE